MSVLFEFSANSQKIEKNAEKSLTYFYNPLLFAPIGEVAEWPKALPC